MTALHLIHGPQGAGQSTHAPRLAQAPIQQQTARDAARRGTFAFEVMPAMFDCTEQRFGPPTPEERARAATLAAETA